MPKVEINGRVVEFATTPTPEDIDHVAASFGAKPEAPEAPMIPTPPEPRTFNVGQTLRQNAPLIGQIAGGLAGGPAAPVTGFLGGIAGSALQRGGRPTIGDIATAAAGEAVPFLPGLLKGALGKAVSRGPAALARGAQAERFGVPLGAGETTGSPVVRSTFGHLATNPFSARTMLRAGTAQSDAIKRAVGSLVEERFGGALPVGQFGNRARRGILATAKLLAPGRSEEMMAAATKLAGETLQSARLAEAVAKDPETLALVMNRVGDAGINDLRQSWLTTVLDDATGKTGLRKGVVTPKRIVDAWQRLGESGQKALFGPRRQFVGDFVGVLENAKAAELAGAKTHFPGYLRWTLVGALGGLGYGHVGGRLAEAAAMEAAAPWVAAHVLTNGPPSAIGNLVQRVGPTAARAGTQALGGLLQGPDMTAP
jgi:hypothetical protein